MSFIKDVYSLFFPKICALCNDVLVKNEETICIKCRFELPLADIIEISDNLVEKTFHGKIDLEFSSSMFFYKRKNKAQILINELKHKGREDIGVFLGKWYGKSLSESKRLPEIDYVIPVPLDSKKLKLRGYNQVTKFGAELAIKLGAKFNETCLISVSAPNAQKFKKRMDRWKNVENNFSITDYDIFKDKSVLLVDDVITTGATIEACVNQLILIKGIKISVVSIAFTS